MTTALLLALALASLPQSQVARLRPADVDGDGLPDVLRLDAAGASLCRNLGGGRFGDPRPIAGACADALWLDVDGDGDPDLLLCSGEGLSVAVNVAGELLVGAPLADTGGARAVSALDLDGDPLPDLHLDLEGGELLLHNLGGLAFEVALRADAASAATLGVGVSGTTPVGGKTAAAPSGLCAGSIFDMALGGCITASSLATLGELYPLSVDFNVDPGSGFVGMGTTSPAERLHVAGVARADGGLRFGDGTLQTTAGTKQWSQLSGVPAGFADGVDDDTLYAAGTGLTLAAGLFGFDTGFGDARYWNETQPLGGDLGGAAATAVVRGLQGRSVAATAPSANQVLKWSGSSWAPAVDLDTNTTYGAGSGLSLTGTTFSVASGGVGAAQLASDAAALAKVTGGGATMTGGALSVNTVSSAARVNIGHASSTSSPHLRLLQDGGSAYGRLEFSNVASPSDWLLAAGLTASPDGDQFNVYHSAAGNVLSVNGQGRVGVETTSPLTALHVVGSLHLQGTAQDISVQSGEQMQFGHYDGTTFTERMRIDGTGNLILSADVEAPTSARWHTSGPEDFTLVYRMNLTTTGSYLFPDSAVSGDARTSLHLPQGATITGVRARIMDSSPDTEVKVRVSRQTFDDNGWIPTILAEATSLGVTAGFTTISTSSVVQPVVNNESYGYYVEVFVPGQVNTGEVRIYRVQVEYTTPASLR